MTRRHVKDLHFPSGVTINISSDGETVRVDESDRDTARTFDSEGARKVGEALIVAALHAGSRRVDE